MKENPIVSIICYAYNHEKYIRDTLNGFVIQKTKFPFEIVIHDDASSDKTPDIIREFERKFPHIFRPIYQTINQHSKEKGKVTKICHEAAQGKYIALCEGDDYWIDSMKLQRQYDIFKNNEKLSAVFTNSMIKNEFDGLFQMFHQDFGVSRKLDEDQIIINGGHIYPTATLLFRKESFDQDLFNNLIQYFAGDMALIYTLLKSGPIYYENVSTAVYRRWVGGVYSSKKNDPEFLSKEKLKEIEGLKILKFLGYSLQGIEKKISINVYQIYKLTGFKFNLIPLIKFSDLIKFLKFKIKRLLKL